ncbi:hypothetical protein JCM8208_003590 [Rhodotorula glutinis]
MATEQVVDRGRDASHLPHLRLPGVAHQLSPMRVRPTTPSSSTHSAPSRMMLRPFSSSSPPRALDSPAEEPVVDLAGQATPSLVVTDTTASSASPTTPAWSSQASSSRVVGLKRPKAPRSVKKSRLPVATVSTSTASSARVRPSFVVDTPALSTPALDTPVVDTPSSARQLEGDASPFPSMPLAMSSRPSRNLSDPSSSTRRSVRPAVPFALTDSPAPSWPVTPEGSSEGSATPDSLTSESSSGVECATQAPMPPPAARAHFASSPVAVARSQMRSPLVSALSARKKATGATYQERLRIQRELAGSPASGSGEDTSSASGGARSPWQTPGSAALPSADWTSSSVMSRRALRGASTQRQFELSPLGVREATSSSSGSDWRPGELGSRFSDWTPSDSPPAGVSSQALRGTEQQQQDDDELFGMLPAVLERGPHARSAGHPLLDLSPHAATSAAPHALVPPSSLERSRVLLRLRALSLEVTAAPRDGDLRRAISMSRRSTGARASRRNSTGGGALHESGAAG